LVVELKGIGGTLEAGLNYLTELGVGVEPLAEEVRWRDEDCVRCTACVSACPTHALEVDRADMEVSFDRERCIACELCLGTCPYGAIEIAFG